MIEGTTYVGYVPYSAAGGDMVRLSMKAAEKIRRDGQAFMARAVPAMARVAGVLLEPPFDALHTEECMMATLPSRTTLTFDPVVSWVVCPVRMTRWMAQRVLLTARPVQQSRVVLAAAGFEVHAVDRDEAALSALDATTRRLGLPVTVEALDLETDGVSLGAGAYALVTVFHYLHRPLLPAIAAAMAEGALLLYETFTVEQAALGTRRTRRSCSSTASWRGW